MVRVDDLLELGVHNALGLHIFHWQLLDELLPLHVEEEEKTLALGLALLLHQGGKIHPWCLLHLCHGVAWLGAQGEGSVILRFSLPDQVLELRLALTQVEQLVSVW